MGTTSKGPKGPAGEKIQPQRDIGVFPLPLVRIVEVISYWQHTHNGWKYYQGVVYHAYHSVHI